MVKLSFPRMSTLDCERLARCQKFTLVGGMIFHCFRPRDEPHLRHEGFAWSPGDASKSYTFSWEEGKRKDLEMNLITHISKHPRIRFWELSMGLTDE